MYTFHDKTGEHSELLFSPAAKRARRERPPVGLQALIVDVVGGEETDVGVHPVLHGQLQHRQPGAHVVLHILLQQLAEAGHHGLLVAELLRRLQGEAVTWLSDCAAVLAPVRKSLSSEVHSKVRAITNNRSEKGGFLLILNWGYFFH